MTAEKALNLYQKIADVKANIDGFTKDTKGYQYTYVSGSQVLHKIRAKMIEHNLLLVPRVNNFSWKEIQVLVKGQLKPNLLVETELTYTWINADNPDERLECPFYAIGHQDDASKAYGTALTYAERYFLMKFFNIPTDDDDADAKQKREKYSKPEPITQDMVGQLKEAILSFAKDNSTTEAAVKDALKVTDYTALSMLDAGNVLQTIKNWRNQQ